MKILFSLTYYRPHVSGVVIYIQRLAEALVSRGHTATILTSRFRDELSGEETLNGVRVIRVPVAFHVSKGAIMPSYGAVARELIRDHDIVALNLPNTPLEAMLIPALARLASTPITATYHCDVNMPSGWWNRLVDKAVFASNWIAGSLVDRLVAYTEDYATHSALLSRFPEKRVVIPPPVTMPEPDAQSVKAFRDLHAPDGQRLIGFAARVATEKGVEYMLEALPRISEAYPGAKVLFAGEIENVIGEEKYWASLQPLLAQCKDNWTFVGTLDPEQMAMFFGACDVSVLPSINKTESFGLVQVESMLCGAPVVASDLPGVRVSIQTTKMGRIVPPRDAQALAEAVIDVITNRGKYFRERCEIERSFSLEKSVEKYETLFEQLIEEKKAS